MAIFRNDDDDGQPVDDAPGGIRVLPLLPPAAHHVDAASLQLGHESRDVGRIVLKVSIGRHDELAPGPIAATARSSFSRSRPKSSATVTVMIKCLSSNLPPSVV